MSTSTRPIPPGHEHLIPHLICDGCSEAIEFNKKAFGAEEIHRLPAPEGRKIRHAALRIGKSFVFLANDFPEFCGGQAQSPTARKGTAAGLHLDVEIATRWAHASCRRPGLWTPSMDLPSALGTDRRRPA